MKRNILIMALGATLAVAGLAIGSDTAPRAAGDCIGPCGPCPLPCAAENAAAMDGNCMTSCAQATAN